MCFHLIYSEEFLGKQRTGFEVSFCATVGLYNIYYRPWPDSTDILDNNQHCAMLIEMEALKARSPSHAYFLPHSPFTTA
jgi:hypothetical protein